MRDRGDEQCSRQQARVVAFVDGRPPERGFALQDARLTGDGVS
jgi:hypothetical protein